MYKCILLLKSGRMIVLTATADKEQANEFFIKTKNQIIDSTSDLVLLDTASDSVLVAISEISTLFISNSDYTVDSDTYYKFALILRNGRTIVLSVSDSKETLKQTQYELYKKIRDRSYTFIGLETESDKVLLATSDIGALMITEVNKASSKEELNG